MLYIMANLFFFFDGKHFCFILHFLMILVFGLLFFFFWHKERHWGGPANGMSGRLVVLWGCLSKRKTFAPSTLSGLTIVRWTIPPDLRFARYACPFFFRRRQMDLGMECLVIGC